jgi:aryl-alcohol dehydrogenase-like predicted oxidoreductase
MELSKIILGCEQLGGKDHGKINFPEISRAFKVSLDLGVNTFDTAAIYNLGQSEKNLEKILKSKINIVNIITKGGLNYRFSKEADRANVYQQFDESFLRANINSSLKRLKLKQLPLFLIHYPPKTNRDMIEICKSLEKFKKQKKILNYGFSNIDYKLFNFAYKNFEIYALENSLNLFNFHDQIKNFKNVNKKVKKIAHSVLAQGMLSGKYTAQTVFPNTDRRHRMNFFLKENIKKNITKVLKLKKIAKKYNTSTIILSLSFLLNSQYVDSIIVGVKNSKQLFNNFSSLNFDMNNKIKEEISSIF